MSVAQALYQQKLREPRIDIEMHVLVSDPYAGIKDVIAGLRSDAARFRMDAITLRTHSALNAHKAWMAGIDEGGASEAKDAAWWSDCRADQLERELKSLIRHLEAQDEAR